MIGWTSAVRTPCGQLLGRRDQSMPNCVSLGLPLGGRPGGSPRTSMGWDMTHRGRHRSYQGRPRTPRGRPNCPADVHGTVDALWTQHGPVDWSPGFTSLDCPRGLAGSRGWFRCLSPWNHMTIESDLPPRVHRSWHELFPRINWKWERLDMRRILIPTSVIFLLKGTDDKTLQSVQMTA